MPAGAICLAGFQNSARRPVASRKIHNYQRTDPDPHLVWGIYRFYDVFRPAAPLPYFFAITAMANAKPQPTRQELQQALNQTSLNMSLDEAMSLRHFATALTNIAINNRKPKRSRRKQRAWFDWKKAQANDID